MPDAQRPMVDMARVRALDPVALRQYLGDGNFGGMYQRSDDEMLALWQVAVDETRGLLTGSWGDADELQEVHKLEIRSQKSEVTHGSQAGVEMRSLIWGAGAIGGTLGAYLARAGVRRHAGRYGRRARRRDQRWRPPRDRADRRVHGARARLHAADARRHVGRDHPGDQGASHRSRGSRARSRTSRRTATWCRRRTGSTSSRSRRWSAPSARSARSSTSAPTTWSRA